MVEDKRFSNHQNINILSTHSLLGTRPCTFHIRSHLIEKLSLIKKKYLLQMKDQESEISNLFKIIRLAHD